MFLIDVLVEYQKIPKQFTYHFDQKLDLYVRVKINFHGQEIVGFVVGVKPYSTTTFETKPILEVIDEKRILNDELLQLGKWMQAQYFTSEISAYNQILPNKLQPKKSAKKPNLIAYLNLRQDKGNTLKQQEAIDYLKQYPDTTRSAFRQMFKSVADRLIKENKIEVVWKEKKGTPFFASIKNNIDYSNDQQKAIKQIQQLTPNEVALLHGVTASGKSEVFFAAIQNIIEKDLQVLLLVPEISLVSQMVKSLLVRFSGAVSLYHSNLNEQEKYECYQLVLEKKVQIVVGTRSAIFLPFSKLGLIIIDEEHDASYKQDKNILYDAKEVAIKRIQYHRCPLLLASATPSITSYAKAYKGVYQLISMPNKIFMMQRDIQLIDMKKYTRNNDYILSKPLMDEIKKTLERNEQVVLILNKRGYANYTKCLSCGYVDQCENCDIALKYHIQQHVLKCHVCGFEKPFANRCSSCGSHTITFQGVGTQKLEEYLNKHFSQYKIARLDKDTTTRKNALTNTLEAFEEGKYHILIGTQMLSKGLDFGNVTLVGIINGDDLLARDSFQSVEQMYQLLVQSFGRSGRKKHGKVFLQVYDTNHYAIQAAVQEDYIAFFKQEMQYRHLANYPPYVYLSSLILQNTNEETLNEDTRFLVSLLTSLEYLGPSPLYKIFNVYRNRLIFKTKDKEALHQKLSLVYEQYRAANRRSSLVIDFSCVSL